MKHALTSFKHTHTEEQAVVTTGNYKEKNEHLTLVLNNQKCPPAKKERRAFVTVLHYTADTFRVS